MLMTTTHGTWSEAVLDRGRTCVALGGIVVLWNSAMFSGTLIEVKQFGVIIWFTSAHNVASWTLVLVYGICVRQERDDFVAWLCNLQIPEDDDWLLLGDFNFFRYTTNRNLPGGDPNDMFVFNDIIGHL